MADLELGKVKWFNDKKGYGFITRDQGKGDVFVHFSGIYSNGLERKTLKNDTLVRFEITQGDRGLKAVNVQSA